MAIRRVTMEFEAKLAPLGAQSANGKIEFKRYADGAFSLCAKLRNLDGVVPDYPLELYVGGTQVGELVRVCNKAELRREGRPG